MKFLFAALALVTVAACHGDETVRAYGAADRIWTLTELDGKPFAASATLTFPQPGQLAGRGPCNSFTATLTAPYPWFEIGPVAATRRACPKIAEESAFLKSLGNATQSEVAGDTLILSNPAGLGMVFTSAD